MTTSCTTRVQCQNEEIDTTTIQRAHSDFINMLCVCLCAGCGVRVGGEGLALCSFIICVDTRHRTTPSPSSIATTTPTSIFNPWQPPISSSFSNFVILRIPYKWNHTTHNPPKLALFIQCNSQRFRLVSSSLWAIFPGTDALPCLWSFTHWRTRGFLSVGAMTNKAAMNFHTYLVHIFVRKWMLISLR